MCLQEIVRESQRRRFSRVEDVDDVIAMDAKWRDARWELDSVNAEFNKANKEVSKLKVAKENADEAIAKVKELAARRVELEQQEKDAEEAVNTLLKRIGNIVHDSVVVSQDEENNAIVRTFGLDTKRMEEKLPNHVDLIAMLDIADTGHGATQAPQPVQAPATISATGGPFRRGLKRIAFVPQRSPQFYPRLPH